jgi:transaldolase
MSSQLDTLKTMTVIVADSGDFSTFHELKPQDATTNPSLILNAAKMPQYQAIIDDAIHYAKSRENGNKQELMRTVLDKLAVNFGVEILKIIPGRVSTEIDARLSYDTQGTIDRCYNLFKMYEEVGINPREKVLFKIASTWEGIRAAEHLEKEGIHTNLTLLFSFCQAVTAADAGVTLISPFVGRILDFWKKETGKDYTPEEDPGVLSVTQIYNYYKKYDYKTIVMGASFRSKGEVLALAGCDYLTISPSLLSELKKSNDTFQRKLNPNDAKTLNIERVHFDEKSFRWALGGDPCATCKLAEGIKKFAEDTEKLEQFLKEKYDLN